MKDNHVLFRDTHKWVYEDRQINYHNKNVLTYRTNSIWTILIIIDQKMEFILLNYENKHLNNITWNLNCIRTHKRVRVRVSIVRLSNKTNSLRSFVYLSALYHLYGTKTGPIVSSDYRSNFKVTLVLRNCEWVRGSETWKLLSAVRVTIGGRIPGIMTNSRAAKPFFRRNTYKQCQIHYGAVNTRLCKDFIVWVMSHIVKLLCVIFSNITVSTEN